MDNSSWLTRLIARTEHRTKQKITYWTFLKRSVALRKTLFYLWMITLILLILETLGNLGFIASELTPGYIARSF